MFRISKITKDIADGVPKWTRAYSDPFSTYQQIINPISITIEDIQQREKDLINEYFLVSIDPDYEAYRAWVAGEEDVDLPEGISIIDLTELSGNIASKIIDIQMVENNDFLEAKPTSYYVADMLDISGDLYASGDPNFCRYNDNNIYTTIQGSKDYLIAALPKRWSTLLDTTFDVSFAVDPLLEINTFEIAVNKIGEKHLYDKYYITDLSGKVATDVLKEKQGITETVDLSGIIDIENASGSEWNTEYYNEAIDFNGDGIIDDDDYLEIAQYNGYRISDYTAKEWNDKYSKYDLNGDGVIDSFDIGIVANSKGSIRNRGAIITMKTGGIWRFELDTTADGLAGTSSFYVKDNFLESVRGEDYNTFKTILPNGMVDGVYDPYSQEYYFISSLEHAIYVVDMLNGDVVDKVKIPVAIRATNSELRGIALHKTDLIVLRKDDEGIALLRYDINDGSFEKTIQSLNVHSGIITEEVILRDEVGLADPHGLTFIEGTKLATIDEGYIKILLPIFDYATIFTNPKTNKTDIHFREKYDNVLNDKSATLYQTYYYLFTQIDEFGLLAGLWRFFGEDNYHFKNRILDVWEHFPDRTKQGITYGIGRELNSDLITHYNDPQFFNVSEDLSGKLNDLLPSANILITDLSGQSIIDNIDIEEVEEKGLPNYNIVNMDLNSGDATIDQNVITIRMRD